MTDLHGGINTVNNSLLESEFQSVVPRSPFKWNGYKCFLFVFFFFFFFFFFLLFPRRKKRLLKYLSACPFPSEKGSIL